MSDEAEPGTVNIELNGKPRTLRATIKAAKIANGEHGFQVTLARLSSMDLATYINVVAAGLELRPVEIENAVWMTGLPDLTEPLSRFVLLLANGGRSLSTTGEAS